MTQPWVSKPFGHIVPPGGPGDTYAVRLANGAWCYPKTRKDAEAQRAAVLKEVEDRGVQFAMCWTKPVGTKLRFKWPVGASPVKVDCVVYESTDKRFMMRIVGTAGVVLVECLGPQYVIGAAGDMDHKLTPPDVIQRTAQLQCTHFFLERLLC